MKEKYVFRPDTSATKEVDRRLLDNRGKYQRISDSKKEIVEYLRMKSINTDLKTGQDLFKPKINEYPIGKRRTHSTCNHRRSLPRIHRRLTSDKSERILKRIKFLRYNAIFQSFSPENGVVSSDLISNASVGPKLRRMLRYIIEELEENDSFIDFGEFCIRMDEIMKRLTPEERNIVIKGEPEMISKSKSVRVSPVKFDIYERNVEKLKSTRRKIENLRKEKKKLELKDCTFAPVLNDYTPISVTPNLWTLFSDPRLNLSSFN